MTGPSPRIVVAGGGITGLSAAFRLAALSKEAGRRIEVTVLDAAPRPGGVIATRTRGGFVLEDGPESFLTEKREARELCVALGLADELIGTNPDPAAARSLIARGGALSPVPEGFFLLAPGSLRALARTPLLSWHGKLRAAFDLALPRRRSDTDESVASFVRRRFGAELLDRIAAPMLSAVYGDDAERLSLRSLLPRFAALEREHRSVILGLRRRGEAAERSAAGPRYSLFETLRPGLSRLVEELVRRLPRGALVPRARIASIRRRGERGELEIRVAGRPAFRADALLLALPAPAAASLCVPFDPELSTALSSIPHASVAVVHLAYRAADAVSLPSAFGFLVPRSERSALTACTFSSVKFAFRAPPGGVLLRAFLSTDPGSPLADADDRRIVSAVQDDLRRWLGLAAAPLFARVARHPRSMPRYEVGHAERAERIRRLAARTPGLFVAGNYLGGVGLSDCIASANSAADASLSYLIGKSR